MGDRYQPSALIKRKSEDMALMPPPPPPKKIKRPSTVLDEDVYTDGISHIIARDFFPGLLESKAQEEYLDALESKDDEWIREAGRNLKEAMTPMPYGKRTRRGTSMAQTPASVATTATPGATPRRSRGGETPREPSATPLEALSESSKPQIDLSLSLTEFQAKYTSEDNASFNDVLDQQNEARAKKYAHLRNNTNNVASNRLLLYREREAQKFLAPSSTSTALIPRPSQDLDARPASYESFPTKQGAKNSFMFAPDSVEDSVQTTAQRAEENSMAPPKRTNFTATRLPGPESEAAKDKIPPSPSMSAVDDAIRGRPRYTDSEKGSVADYNGAETPMVNGWKFVDEEPTAVEEAFANGEPVGRPVDDEEAARQERAEAMKLLPKVEQGAGFKMGETGRREELHHRLVEKTSARERKKALETRRDQGKGSMTPAARTLAGRLGTPARMPGDLFGGSKSADARKSSTPMRTPVIRR